MSDSKPSGICASFQPHPFKKNICVTCKRGQTLHHRSQNIVSNSTTTAVSNPKGQRSEKLAASDQKNSSDGNKDVESALRKLTSSSATTLGSPKSSRASRTTMNYAASSTIRGSVGSTANTAAINGLDPKLDNSVANTPSQNRTEARSSFLFGNAQSNELVNKTGNNKEVPTAACDKTAAANGCCAPVENSSAPGIQNCRKPDRVAKSTVIVDKGKFATEKVVIDNTVVVSSTKRSESQQSKQSATSHPNKNDPLTAPCKKTVGRASTSVSKPNGVLTLATVSATASVTRASAISAAPVSITSASTASRISTTKLSTIAVATASTSSKKSPTPVCTTSATTLCTTSTVASTVLSSQPSCRSTVAIMSNKKQSLDVDQNKQTDVDLRPKRSRSKTTPRPQAPPPKVPQASKAMTESFHSQVSQISDSHSSDSQYSGPNGTCSPVQDSQASFSDLYNDIMNSLRNITPELMQKLKQETSDPVPQQGHDHYYHTYDRGSKEMPSSMTSSVTSFLGTGSASITVETMSTSFHGNVSGEVTESHEQHFTLPYNIVDVSKHPPSKHSPKIPKTPAPEESTSRHGTMEKRYTKTDNGKDVSHLSSSEMGGDVCAGGPPPKYWHTYEPVEVKTSNTLKSKTDNDTDSFTRHTPNRATTPVGRSGNKVVNRESSLRLTQGNTAPLMKGSSKSADDLTDDIASGKAKVDSKGKADKKPGFLCRLFGFGRKTSLDTEFAKNDEAEPMILSVDSVGRASELSAVNVADGVQQSPKSKSADNIDFIDEAPGVVLQHQTSNRLSALVSSTTNHAAPSSKSNSLKKSVIICEPPVVPGSKTAVALFAGDVESHSSKSLNGGNVSDTFKTPQIYSNISGEVSPVDSPSVFSTQASVCSEGSSDGKSVSSREEQGSSGDSRELNLKPRRSRPKSVTVSRKMLDAPPPPPVIPEGQVTSTSQPCSSLTSQLANPRVILNNHQNPTSPSKYVSTNGLGKPAIKVKPKRNSMSSDEGPGSPRRLEISGPIELQSTTFSCQTLPRPVKSSSSFKETRDDSHMDGTRRKMDSAAKHARNKTVTEGVKFDSNLLTERTDVSKLQELLENRANKFQNRALPPTPSPSNTTKPAIANKPASPTKYEAVRGQAEPRAVRRNYEQIDDEDIYADPVYEEEENMIPDFRKNGNPSSCLKAPPSMFADYLLPSEEKKRAGAGLPLGVSVYGEAKNTLVKDDLTPKLIARSSGSTNTSGKLPANSCVSMMYVNTEMIISHTLPPLDVGEGFKHMAFINVESLMHTATKIFNTFLQADAKVSDELKFSHFVLKSTRPFIAQSFVNYFLARSYKLSGQDCYLMISAMNVNPDLLHHTCVNLLQANVIFSDKILANYFPSPSPPDKVQSDATRASTPTALAGLVYTNIAVLMYSSIQLLETWIRETLSKLDSDAVERKVCYAMFQIINGTLSSHEGTSLYTIKTLNLHDLVIVSNGRAVKGGDKPEEYVVVNPLATSEQEYMEDEVLCHDLLKVLAALLSVPTSGCTPAELAGRLVVSERKSRYAVALRQCGKTLATGTTITSVMVARSVLQYVLWGPKDTEVKSLLVAEDRQHAFCIWLEVMRCRCINELALGQIRQTLELASKFQFLCTVTGATLLELTKLLYVRQR